MKDHTLKISLIYCTILYYTILYYYTTLYYTILYYTILYHIIYICMCVYHLQYIQYCKIAQKTAPPHPYFTSALRGG